MLDWSLPLALAIATGSLAAAAFWAIWQNRLLQNRERRERLLNEIIEWAEDIGKCGIEPDIELYLDYRIAGDYDYDTTTREIEDGEGKSNKVIAAEIKHRKQLLTHILMYRTKNNYMSIIAPKINKELGAVMAEVVSGLDKQLGLLRKALIDVEHTSTTDISLELGKLTKSATKLIEKATKIKTKDIGKKEENVSKEGNVQAKKIADVQIAFGAGLAAMIFSAQFLPIPQSWLISLILLAVGGGTVGWASRQWRKLVKN